MVCLIIIFPENGTPKNQKGKRKGNVLFNGGNYSYNEGPVRKPTPQKYKNTWDKRPRSRGGVSDRPRSDVGILIVSHSFPGPKNFLCYRLATVPDIKFSISRIK